MQQYFSVLSANRLVGLGLPTYLLRVRPIVMSLVQISLIEWQNFKFGTNFDLYSSEIWSVRSLCDKNILNASEIWTQATLMKDPLEDNKSN